MLEQNLPAFHGVRAPGAPAVSAARVAAPPLADEVDAVAHAPRRRCLGRAHRERRFRAHEDGRVAAGQPLDLRPASLRHVQPVHLEAGHAGDELGMGAERRRDGFPDGEQLPDEQDLPVGLQQVTLPGESLLARRGQVLGQARHREALHAKRWRLAGVDLGHAPVLVQQVEAAIAVDRRQDVAGLLGGRRNRAPGPPLAVGGQVPEGGRAEQGAEGDKHVAAVAADGEHGFLAVAHGVEALQRFSDRVDEEDAPRARESQAAMRRGADE